MSQKWRAFIAKFAGWCPLCEQNIEIGEDCCYGPDDKVVHLACAEEYEEEE